MELRCHLGKVGYARLIAKLRALLAGWAECQEQASREPGQQNAEQDPDKDKLSFCHLDWYIHGRALFQCSF